LAQLIPLINVTLPLLWKSFAGVYTADVIALAGLYAWKEAFPWSEPKPKPEVME
jgi:hypothetical protein